MATSVLAALWLVILGSRDGCRALRRRRIGWRRDSRMYLTAFQARFRAAMKMLWRRYAIVSTDL